jgi:hypothetical protein
MELVMNVHRNVRRRLDREDGDHGIPVDGDAPFGLPGESAPEITLAEDEGREEKKRGAADVFEGVLANFRGALARRKTSKSEGQVAGVDGQDEESPKAVDHGAVEGPSEEEGSDGAIESEGDAKAGGKRKIDQRVLLGGIAAGAVAVVMAGVALWPSSPKRPVVAEQGMAAQPLLAPAASLASVPKPEISPAPELPSKSGDPLKEILALGQRDDPSAAKGAGPKPAEDKAARVDDGVQKGASAPTVAEKPNADPPVAARDVAPGDLPEKVAAKPIVEAPRPQSVAEAGMVNAGDQVDAGRNQVPAVKEPSQSPQDRVEAMRTETALLERVTQLAALVAHLNDQVNRLQSAQAKLSSGTEERYADLQRRMALAESGKELDAAANAQDARHFQSLAVPNPPESRAPARVVMKTGPAASVESLGEKRPYRVQAASPSLAMLGTGGNEPPLEVTPGATVPGWGRVSKIEQRGQTWVVVTAGGVIQ